MCIKNVNAVSNMYANIVNPIAPVAYEKPFNTLYATANEYNTLTVGSFYIVTNVNIISTADKDDTSTLIGKFKNEKSPLACKDKYKLNILIVIQQFGSSEKIILDSFSININNDTICEACRPFVSSKMITKVDLNAKMNYSISKGKYAIKVLLQEEPIVAGTEKEWALQSFSLLTIE